MDFKTYLDTEALIDDHHHQLMKSFDFFHNFQQCSSIYDKIIGQEFYSYPLTCCLFSILLYTNLFIHTVAIKGHWKYMERQLDYSIKSFF